MARTVRSLSVLLVGVLLAAACVQGESDTTLVSAQDGPGRFCELLQDFAGLASRSSYDEVEAVLSELQEEAPEDAAAAIGVLREVFADLAALPPNDPTTLEAVFEQLLSPEVIQAGLTLQRVARDECDVELDPLGGPTTPDDPDDPADLDIAQLESHLDENYGDAAWVDAISTWSISQAFDDGDVSAAGDLTGEQGLAACRAIAEKVYEVPERADWTITVSTADGTQLATSPGADEGCAPA